MSVTEERQATARQLFQKRSIASKDLNTWAESGEASQML